MNRTQKDLFERQVAPWEEDDESLVCVATVVFVNAPEGEFDYQVPTDLISQVEPGRRLRVPLGRGNRQLTGYCVGVIHRPSDRPLKSILRVVDNRGLLSAAILRMTRWMSEYYICSWGRVLEAVLPAGVRDRAGTREMTLLSVPNRVLARLSTLDLTPKQSHVMQTLAAAGGPLTAAELAAAADCSSAPIAALRQRKLIASQVKRVQSCAVREAPIPRETALKLNPDQRHALDEIQRALDQRKHLTALLHGVTGSGKTEVYIQAIEGVVRGGRQAIVLVPEISLTPQTRQRFRSRFDNVAVLHSNLTPSERHWHWQRIANGEVQVVVGARSAIFAPTPNLGLIVVDEEHESSFKQDTSPCYHARDVARYRAQTEEIPLVLGTATPALETYYRAKKGEFKLLSLPRRVEGRPLPVVDTIDLRNRTYDRMDRGAISRGLDHAIRNALTEGGQVILLLNRRGYSTVIQCPACGTVVNCPHCDISLTHHRDIDQAICHYCDYQTERPPRCPDCGFADIRFGGSGTQRLELEINKRFPDHQCLRMDSDTMKGPGRYETALSSFRNGEVDILLGTQMIAKGLDFPNVTLVGVINADTALHLPDFRAAERTFQLVTQVAGRTGRGGQGGRVLVQSYSPEHAAIQCATSHDYETFAATELPIRQQFGYPPMTVLVRVVFRGPSEVLTQQAMDSFAELLRAEIAGLPAARVLGPAPAPVAKLRGNYRFHLLLLGSDHESLRPALLKTRDQLKTAKDIQSMIDVDPTAMM